jgi:hypothetical protein
MKNFNEINLDITGDSNRIGSYTNVLGLVVSKTTGTTSTITPSELSTGADVTITVPTDGAIAWKVGGRIRCHVDANANNYWERLNNAAQIETATAGGTVTTEGWAVATLLSRDLSSGTPIAVEFTVKVEDTPEIWAKKAVDALRANTQISGAFEIRNSLDKIVVIRKPTGDIGQYPLYPLNDPTLNLSLDNSTGSGASVGIIASTSSADTSDGADFEDSIVGTITSIDENEIVIDVSAVTPSYPPVEDITAWIVSYRGPNFTSRLTSLLNDFKDDLDELENMSL